MTGIIFDIKEFAVHDGGGVRSTVFCKGCPLRCVWCHNPEGQHRQPELMRKSGCTNCGKCRIPCTHPECAPFGLCLHACPDGRLRVAGKTVEAEELAAKLSADAELYRISGGGVTVSGGEPLMQPDFVIALCDALHKKGIHCTLETCGFASSEVFASVVSHFDFVYCDLKLADDEQHKKYTGVSNKQILANIEYLRKSGIPYRLRTPLIPDITDTEENLTAIRAITQPDEMEYLPYNKMAGAKYALLGREYSLNPLE